MRNASKKLLIVAETFPPMPGIGGRRWAKFAKYFHRLGVDVHVLTRAYTGEEPSLWSGDVSELPAEHIHVYSDEYPEVLRKAKLSVFDRVRYKLALAKVMRRVPGNPYDRAVFVGDTFQEQLSKLIEAHGISTVITTGPSFNLLYYAALVHEKRGDFKLWVDFRDGWTWDTRYGMGILSPERKAEEQRKEAFVIARADRVLTPSVYHFNHLKALYPYAMSKMEVATHAFDMDDLPSISERKNKHARFVYGGTLYDDLEPVFEAMNRSFERIHPKTVTIDLYLSNPHKLDTYLKRVDERWHSCFVLHPQRSPKDFYTQVSGAQAFIFWAGVPTKISSKVFEILACGTPIVNISPRGELAGFLEQKAVGVHFTPDEFCFARIDGIFDGLKPDEVLKGSYPDYETLAQNLANEIQ